MSDLHQGQNLTLVTDLKVDLGLRRYMLGVYNRVGFGLLLAAGLAHVTASVGPVRDLLFRSPPAGAASPLVGLTVLGSLVAVGPILILLAATFLLARPTPLKAGAVYWSVVSLIGASLGVLVLTFTGVSIATTFAISALAFAGLSLFGYVARRDLTAFGGFLTMGLIGFLATLVVNLILQSPAVIWIANLVGVFLFAGLIAYDTQRLKLGYARLEGDPTAIAVASNFAALSLFINFINLFQFLLLTMTGGRR